MGDIHDLEEFLGRVDLTASGLDSPTARLWIERDPLLIFLFVVALAVAVCLHLTATMPSVRG